MAGERYGATSNLDRDRESRRSTSRGVTAQTDPLPNLARVRELRPLPSGDYVLTMRSGATVTLSRTYRDAVLARLG